MSLRITGKHVDVGDSLRAHIEGRLEDYIGKYYEGGFSGHVTLEKEGHNFRCENFIHLDTGITLQSTGAHEDAYKAFDAAAERVEKRMRRYKRRLKNHHGKGSARDGIDGASGYYVVQSPEGEDEPADDFQPVIVAEEQGRIRTMTPGTAVLDLDLSGAPVLVFKNASSGQINVVYRRQDGHFGWIDPQETAEK